MTELFALSKNELASKLPEQHSSLAEQAFNLLKEHSTTLAVVAGATILGGIGLKALARGGKVLGSEAEATLATGELRDALRVESHSAALTSRNFTPDGSPARVSLGDNLSLSRNFTADGSAALARHPALEPRPPVPPDQDIRFSSTFPGQNEHMADVAEALLRDFKPAVDTRAWITNPAL